MSDRRKARGASATGAALTLGLLGFLGTGPAVRRPTRRRRRRLPRSDAAERRPGGRPGAAGAGPGIVQVGHRRSAEQTGRWRLADVPPHLRRLGLQPAGSDHRAANAARLHPVWSMATGQVEGHQAPPIVNNGVMFVATPGNQVLAINAKTGDLLWRFKRPIPEDMLQLHPTSRGVGLWGDKVFFAATDATLVALDAKTGKEVWNAKVEDYAKGYYMSLAPLVIDGKVLVGVVRRRTWRARLRRRVRCRDRQGSCGGPTPFLRPASPAARPGRRAISGRPAAARSGSPACMIRRPT